MIGDFAHADIGPEPVRRGLCELNAKKTTQAVTKQNDPIPLEAISQVIPEQLRDGHGFVRNVAGIRHARPALFPPDHREVTLKTGHSACIASMINSANAASSAGTRSELSSAMPISVLIWNAMLIP